MCDMTEKPLIRALKGERISSPPVWLMRQAGRYLPEYRELRARKNGFLDMALDPEAACEITLQPIRRFGMDAAILFSDILMIPFALDQDLEFVPGEGPKLGDLPWQSLDTEKIHVKLNPVYEAVERVREELKRHFPETALIGFAGAPWTVACYMVEGGGSKDFGETKTLAFQNEEQFQALIDVLIESTAAYLGRQIEAGAEAVQIFDSWAGVLDSTGFQKWVIEPNRRVIDKLKQAHPDIPVIGFPRGAGLLYEDFVKTAGVDAIGIDQMIPLGWVARTLQPYAAVQGNLDPFILRAGGAIMEERVRGICHDLSGGAHVFNLGHGVNKETPPEHVSDLIRIIREYDYGG